MAALVRSGFYNVVASLGTAVTPAQARLVARFTRRVVFSYDGDTAGAAATARSLDLLLGRGFEVRVVELPGGAGFGNPYSRPVELVAIDVRNGVVSRVAARDKYGVVIGQDGAVDEAETAKLRR